MQLSKRLFIFLGISVQAIVLCTSFFYLQNIHQNKTGESEEDVLFSALDEVSTPEQIPLKIPFLHTVTGNGRVVPSSGYLEITPGVFGEIIEVNVQPGDLVKEGDLLFKIDDSEYRFSLREKIADYDVALASLKLLNEGPSRLTLQAKEKEIDQIRIKLERVEEQCSIFETLLEKQAVSENENKEKTIEKQMLSKELEKTLTQYEKLKEGPSHSEIEIRKAQIKKTEASVHAVEKKLRKCHAYSPISGRVFSVNLHKGETVSREKSCSIVLGSEDPLYLKVEIDESQAWRISPTKSLRAIAVHKSNPNIHFILNYVSLKPLLNKTKGENGKLELTFSFEKSKSPVYVEEELNVYIEAASPLDTSYLDYQFSQLK